MTKLITCNHVHRLVIDDTETEFKTLEAVHTFLKLREKAIKLIEANIRLLQFIKAECSEYFHKCSQRIEAEIDFIAQIDLLTNVEKIRYIKSLISL